MKTREQLVNRAIDLLGALPTGQSADPDVYAKVDATVETVLSPLASRNIYQWGDPDQIEDDAFEYLARCLAEANHTVGGFSKPDLAAIDNAEKMLRQLFPAFLSGHTLKADYF